MSYARQMIETHPSASNAPAEQACRDLLDALPA